MLLLCVAAAWPLLRRTTSGPHSGQAAGRNLPRRAGILQQSDWTNSSLLSSNRTVVEYRDAARVSSYGVLVSLRRRDVPRKAARRISFERLSCECRLERDGSSSSRLATHESSTM